MNVKGPGHPPPPGVPGPDGDDRVQRKSEGKPEEPSSVRGAAKPNRPFVENVARPRQAAGASSATGARASDVSVNDLAADLEAGRLTSRDAIDKIVDRVLARQIGPEAPAAIRDQVRTTLQEAIASDPLLADKLRQVEREGR
jgi:hypothetical protein